MPRSHLWTRDELLLAMNLYCRIPFGRQHARAPEVVELAQRLGRTPSSVAMKLSNLTSLDPEEARRGVRGLRSASTLDRQVWEEFHSNWEALAAESEALWERAFGVSTPKEPEGQPDTSAGGGVTVPQTDPSEVFDMPSGPTEVERTVQARRGQDFFRRAVLAAYNARCCITGNPVPELLIASHILPWKHHPEHRVNPRNGLCLSRLHDGAFDYHLISFDEDLRLILSRRLRDYATHETIRLNFTAYEGRVLNLPDKFHPDPSFLARHRETLLLNE